MLPEPERRSQPATSLAALSAACEAPRRLPDHPETPPQNGTRKSRARFSPKQLEEWVERTQTRLLAWLGGWPSLRSLSVVILPLALSPWLFAELRKELDSALFRDAAQCQYSAWCLRHGARLYRDVGAPDGPLTHFLHAFLQLFGGISDHGFRRADLGFQLVCSGAMGIALGPRFVTTRAGAWLSHAAWACLGAGLWLCWYLMQGPGLTIQRDAYFALLGYLGLVLVYASADHTPKVARMSATLGGVLCMLLVFSRHTGVVYPAAAVLGIVLCDDPAREQRNLRLKAALQGMVIGFAAIGVGLLFFGSFSGLVFWYFRFPFTYYRWLSKQNAFHLFSEGYPDAADIAILALIGVFVAVGVRALPRRALVFGLVPMLSFIGACLQGKGWPNHVQQTTAATVVLELLVLSEIWKHRAGEAHWSPAQATFAALALCVAAYDGTKSLHTSWFFAAPLPVPVDSDIVEAERIGNYLKNHTPPDGRIFYYGHEAHTLLNAERLPATPYYVTLSFNIERLYERQPPARGEEPNAEQRAAIRALQRQISREACRDIKATPPAAMVFLDGSLGIWGDGRAETIHLCPAVGRMLQRDYHEVAVPDVPAQYHIFLRGQEPSAS